MKYNGPHFMEKHFWLWVHLVALAIGVPILALFARASAHGFMPFLARVSLALALVSVAAMLLMSVFTRGRF